MSTQEEKDAGLMAALEERYHKQRLPRVLALKEKVERGEVLDDFDTAFIQEVLDGIREIQPLIHRHHECLALVSNMIKLCNEITARDLENEKSPTK